MFSLIPKTDTGLWLGPLFVQSTSSSFIYPRPFGQSWWFFSIVPVLAGSMAVMWTIIMHLREFRLLIHSRSLLSPALLSPHHITPRIKSTRGSCRSDWVCLVVSRQELLANKNPVSLKLFVPLQTWFIIKRCLYFNAPNSVHHTFIWKKNPSYSFVQSPRGLP